MTVEALDSPVAVNPTETLARLGTTLVEDGAIERTLERARRSVADIEGRLEGVLTPALGLVSVRALAEAPAQLLGLGLRHDARVPHQRAERNNAKVLGNMAMCSGSRADATERLSSRARETAS
jgi:hypothetical protein